MTVFRNDIQVVDESDAKMVPLHFGRNRLCEVIFSFTT